MCANIYFSVKWFDNVIAKIKWCSPLTHIVEPPLATTHQIYSIPERRLARCFFDLRIAQVAAVLTTKAFIAIHQIVALSCLWPEIKVVNLAATPVVVKLLVMEWGSREWLEFRGSH